MWRAIVVVLILCVACGSGTTQESAGDALRRQLGAVSKGQYGRDWDELHPAEQALVSRERFTACEMAVTGAQIERVSVVETYRDPIAIASVPEKTSTAVTVRLSAHGVTEIETYHEVNVDGRWRWVLSDDAVKAYQQGKCPA